MKQNPILVLENFGQSIWLDYLERDLFTSGKLKKLINDVGLRGMTSNPTIFEKAISKGGEYENDIEKMKKEQKDVKTVYEILTQQDIRMAADEFRPLFDKLNGADGFVSLEVNPHLAENTQGTIEEARRLWKALDKPNVLIKVPATKQGLPAIQQLISEGINVNITLLFGLPRYREVAEAYISGLEARLAMGQPINTINSVASFFLSRIDVLIDPLLEKMIARKDEKASIAAKIKGETAIASAKLAYQIYKEVFQSPRFKKLQEKGAKIQRLLWASTSTKNPDYSDVKYVEPLIGLDTINTVPVETLESYIDHGKPESTLEKDIDHAQWVFQTLPKVGVDIDHVTHQLEEEGVEKFNQSFDKLLDSLRRKLA